MPEFPAITALNLHPISMEMKKMLNASRFLGAFTSYMMGFMCGGWLLLTAAQRL